MASEATRIQLCGRLAVRLDGRRVEGGLPGRQGRRLFAYLVLNRLRPLARDELIEALWPGDLPAAADTSLYSLLSKLRRALGPERLEGGTDVRLMLPSDVFVDVEAADEAIHRAESAVRRGAWADAWAPARVALHTTNRTFLAGDDIPWIDRQRRHLEEARLRAHECVARAGIGLGGPELDAALRSSRTLIELAPFRESGHRLLMQALVAEGNAAEALAVYEQLRQTLREDLGTTPSAPTQELYKRLLG